MRRRLYFRFSLRPQLEAIDLGAAEALSLHNTGEGGVSPHHLLGADLVMQIGTAYFGCRDDSGRFSMERLADAVANRRNRCARPFSPHF